MLASGCGGAEPADPNTAVASEVPRPWVAPSPVSPGAAPRIVLVADGTPRLELLNSLAESEGFVVSGPTDGLGVANARFEGDRIEAVLTALLHDVPFDLHYRLHERLHEQLPERRGGTAGDGGKVRLAELELWPLPRSATGEAAPRVSPSDVDVSAAGRRARATELAERLSRGGASGSEFSARQERIRETAALAREEALQYLESDDALERQSAAAALGAANSSDARRLGELALHDPDPRVRLEAVEQLGFGDPHVVLPILTDAALDPDESVAGPARAERDHALGRIAAED